MLAGVVRLLGFEALRIYDLAHSAQVHSHTYDTTDIPAAKFTYDLSPIQILVSEKRRAWCVTPGAKPGSCLSPMYLTTLLVSEWRARPDAQRSAGCWLVMYHT